MKNLSLIDAYIIGSASGCLLFLCLIGLVIVGNMSADDLTDEQNAYCQNVYEETHPDYKNIFAKSCIGWLTEHGKSVN